MATDFVAYGIYPHRDSFERAVEALRAAGFRNSDISVILPERDKTTRDLAHEINTKAPEGIAAGAGSGAALGGVLGWLVGIGAIAIPGGQSSGLLVQFDLAGIAVSAGSACSSGAMKESRVLKAMQVDPAIASSFLRISFGPSTSEADVDAFLAEWQRIASRQRAA